MKGKVIYAEIETNVDVLLTQLLNELNRQPFGNSKPDDEEIELHPEGASYEAHWNC